MGLAGVVAVLALQGLAIARQSVTSDEAFHLLAGYQAGRHGQNGLNLEHPPLVKMIAALPLLATPDLLAAGAHETRFDAIYTASGVERRARLGGARWPRPSSACRFSAPPSCSGARPAAARPAPAWPWRSAWTAGSSRTCP